MNKLKYSLENIAALGSVKVIVSKYVPDNQIVLKQPKDISRQPSRSPKTFASYHLSIWNLDKGEIYGDCDLTKATEWHMSPIRFKQLQEMDSSEQSNNKKG